MRQKSEAVLSFESSDEGLPKVVRQYRGRYRAISQVLDANPEILTVVHKDLARTLKFARIWGSATFDGQQVGRDHRLVDGDVVELHS